MVHEKRAKVDRLFRCQIEVTSTDVNDLSPTFGGNLKLHLILRTFSKCQCV